MSPLLAAEPLAEVVQELAGALTGLVQEVGEAAEGVVGVVAARKEVVVAQGVVEAVVAVVVVVVDTPCQGAETLPTFDWVLPNLVSPRPGQVGSACQPHPYFCFTLLSPCL